MSEQQTLNEEGRMKLEDKILRYFQNKDIAKERQEENKILFEEIEEIFQESGGEEEIVIPLPSGMNAVLSPKFFEKEILDKDMLAEEMMVPKDELKTPFDFCAFTSQGKLTPAMITKHTNIERGVKLSLTRKKSSSRKRKRKS